VTVPESVRFTFTAAERDIYRKRERPPVSAWASQHIVVQDGPYAGSRLRLDATPYLGGIMDTLYQSGVEEVDVCASPQGGKSELMFACLLYSIAHYPGPKLLAMPDEATLARAVTKKFLPRLKGSAALRRVYLRDNKDAIELRDGSTIYLSSALSPAQRASVTVLHEFLDEVDLYRQLAGQGDPINELRERTISYGPKRRVLAVAKPMGDETSTIWTMVTKECDELRRYVVVCPCCGTLQVMTLDNVAVLDGCTDPREIKRRRLGRYQCPHCKYMWTDHARDVAVGRGEWRADEAVLRPRRVGFHMCSLIYPFVSLSEIAADKVEAESIDDDKVKREFRNGRGALPFTPVEIDTKPESVLARRAMWLPAKTVPVEAVAVTCGIDTQATSFWFAVLAWGASLQSWLIDYGQIATWEDVMALVHETRYPILGRPGADMGIWRAAIDSGGNVSEHQVLTRTEEVYAWCRSRGEGRLFPIKGRSREHYVPVSWSVVDKLPKSGRAIPGGLRLYLLDVGYLKRLVFKRLSPDARQPMLLNAGTEATYAKHMAAERLVRARSGTFVWEAVSRENHLLDATMMAHACTDGSWTPSLQYLLAQADEQEADQAIAPGSAANETSTLAMAARRASDILAARRG